VPWSADFRLHGIVIRDIIQETRCHFVSWRGVGRLTERRHLILQRVELVPEGSGITRGNTVAKNCAFGVSLVRASSRNLKAIRAFRPILSSKSSMALLESSPGPSSRSPPRPADRVEGRFLPHGIGAPWANIPECLLEDPGPSGRAALPSRQTTILESMLRPSEKGRAPHPILSARRASRLLRIISRRPATRASFRTRGSRPLPRRCTTV
jgi:hypothetical protein